MLEEACQLPDVIEVLHSAVASAANHHRLELLRNGRRHWIDSQAGNFAIEQDGEICKFRGRRNCITNADVKLHRDSHCPYEGVEANTRASVFRGLTNRLDGDSVRVILNPIRIAKSKNVGKNFPQAVVARVSEAEKVGGQCRVRIVAVLPDDEKIASLLDEQVPIRRYG